jgi:hypothetical protein
MTSALAVGDRVRLSGGYEFEPHWLAGNSGYFGAVRAFIPGQNETPAAVVRLDEPITFEGTTGDVVVLELRYVGAKWKATETVHVELCEFMPEPVASELRRYGKWIESHATYVRL